MAHLLDAMQVALVGHAAGQVHVDGLIRLVVVGDDCFGETGVGYDYQVVGPGPETGTAPIYVHHVSRHTVLHFDVVADTDDALGYYVSAGEKVAESGLQRQRHRQAAEAEAGNQWGDVDAQNIQGQHGRHG